MTHLLKSLAHFCIVSVSLFCSAQTQQFTVHPQLTDVNYSSSDDDHVITINTVTNNNKLFLFLVGTGSGTSNYFALRNLAADLGYDVISLSYFNDIAAVSLADSTDSMAFNYYRQELCFGTPVSNAVTADTLNSIYTRTLNLLNYLAAEYPAHTWDNYLTSPTTIDWSKVVIGGHSQGSGHAAYIAKHFEVDRVLMFSGPNDYSNVYSNSANWLRALGITPTSQHYIYLSLYDEVDYGKQFVNATGLGMLDNDDSTHVDNIPPPFGNSKHLYTTQPPGVVILNHNVPIFNTTINEGVWEYMLTDPNTSGLTENETSSIVIFPNPVQNTLTIQLNESSGNTAFSVTNLAGGVVKTGEIEGGIQLDVSDLPKGVYLLHVEEQVVRFVKE